MPDGRVFVATGNGRRATALDGETGERVRSWPVENVGSQVAVAGRTLYYRAWNVSNVVAIG